MWGAAGVRGARGEGREGWGLSEPRSVPVFCYSPLAAHRSPLLVGPNKKVHRAAFQVQSSEIRVIYSFGDPLAE